MPEVKDTAGPSALMDHGNNLPTPILDSSTQSYSVNAAIAPAQLELLQDLSISESKTYTLSDHDSGMLGIEEKSTLSIESPTDRKFSTRDDEEVSSSGDLTPISEASDSPGESAHLTTYDIDGQTLLNALKCPLDTLFKDWLGGIRFADGGEEKGSSSSSSPAARANGQPPPNSKRKRIVNADNEDSDTGPDKALKTTKRTRKLNPLDKLLACPYFKKDPRRHRACCGFGFTKISYVKTHLYQKHTIPIYCPFCYQTFANTQLRDTHSRERNCEPAEDHLAPDGITSDQRDLLSRRVPKRLTMEDQWFHIFDLLFPNHQPRPRSAYNDTEFSETLHDFRDFISEPTGQEALLRRVRENPAWTSELEETFRPDLVHGLNQLYWEWAGTEDREAGQVPAIETPLQEPRTSSARSTNEETTVQSSQPETGLGDRTNSLAPEAATRDTSGTATSEDISLETMENLQEGQLPSDCELEDRKVDEADQMPPRQLNHDGINLVPEQNPWPSAGFSELDDVTQDIYGFTDDIDHVLAADYAFSNPLDDIEIAESWISNLYLPGYGTSLPLDVPEASEEPPVNPGVTGTSEETDTCQDKRAESEEVDGFVIITQSPT